MKKSVNKFISNVNWKRVDTTLMCCLATTLVGLIVYKIKEADRNHAKWEERLYREETRRRIEREKELKKEREKESEIK